MELGNPVSVPTTRTLSVLTHRHVDLPASVPAGGNWTAIAAGTGYRYRDTTRAQEGVFQLKLRQGATNRPSVIVKADGRGQNLGNASGFGSGNFPVLPAFPLGPLPLRTQLLNNTGACWEATMTTVTTNVAGSVGRYRGKGQ
jgi:hypothetical protein